MQLGPSNKLIFFKSSRETPYQIFMFILYFGWVMKNQSNSATDNTQNTNKTLNQAKKGLQAYSKVICGNNYWFWF